MGIRQKWLLGVSAAIAVVGALVALGISEQSQAKGQLAAARTAARKAGIPLTEEEYRALFPVPTESENAWPVYLKTIQIYRPSFGGTDPADRFAQPGPEEEAINGAFEGFDRWITSTAGWDPPPAQESLESLEPVLESGAALASRPKFHFEDRFRLGVAGNQVEATHVYRLASLFLFDALIAGNQGNTKRAEERLAVASAIADHLWQSSAFQAREFGFIVATKVMALAKWFLCSGKWPHFRLERLEAAIGPVLETPDFKRAFRGYVFRGLLTIDTFSSASKMREAGLGRRATNRSAPRPAIKEDTERAWLDSASKLLQESGTDYLTLLEAAKNHQTEMTDAMGAYNRFLQDRPETTAPIAIWIVSTQSHAAKAALMKGLIAGLKRYRSDGAFPDQLPLSGDDATDPFSNNPLSFERTSDGFLIWSVGINGENDHGSNEREDNWPKDWVVRYPSFKPGW